MTDDTIALPPLPDRITETGARRIFLTEQEAMDYAREAVRLDRAGREELAQELRCVVLTQTFNDTPVGHRIVDVCTRAAHMLAAAPATPPDAQDNLPSLADDHWTDYAPGVSAFGPGGPPDAALDAARYVP